LRARQRPALTSTRVRSWPWHPPKLHQYGGGAFVIRFTIRAAQAHFFGHRQRLLQALLEIPEKMNTVLKQADNIQNIAKQYQQYHNILFMGRGVIIR